MSLFDGLVLPASGDFHVHLRDGDLMRAVTPTIQHGGVDTVFVMPNLVPPITTVEQALSYQSRLQALAPNVQFLMSLYLHSSTTPDIVRQAKRAGIHGIKSYPAGVTTNSASGVVDYELFYPVFQAMEEEDVVLNLHGESPPADDITVLNAEEAFLPTLLQLHQRFPRLRIVLEHCTTAAAIEAVRRCGPTVTGTITAHHLFLIVDDWANDPLNFCKPVAKLPSDRQALIRAATSGDGKFFLGTDSAPHLLTAKRGGNSGIDKCAAGVFTQPYATQLVLEALEMAVKRAIIDKDSVKEDILRGFLGLHGRRFYALPASKNKMRIHKSTEKVVESFAVGENGEVIVPFRRNQAIYSIEWLPGNFRL